MKKRNEKIREKFRAGPEFLPGPGKNLAQAGLGKPGLKLAGTRPG